MDIRLAIPFLIAADAASVSNDSWAFTVANYGVATGMLTWFMWRDKLDRDERRQEKSDQQKRHEENLAASKKIEEAFRNQTNLLIVGLAAMKTIDAGYASLLEKIKNTNSPEP